MAVMQLSVNLKTLIDFFKNQTDSGVFFPFPPPFVFPLLPIDWNCQGQVYCGLRKSCLLTLPSAENKNKNVVPVCICCVLKFRLDCGPGVTHQSKDNVGCRVLVAHLPNQNCGSV